VLELSQNDKGDTYKIGKLGRSIGLLREFQAPLYDRRPDLRPPPPWEGVLEPSLTGQEKDRVSELTDERIQSIDDALLSLANERFQKVAKIVLSFMSHSDQHVEGLPDLYYGQRIEHLVGIGKLESQGNLKFMQYCEVRVPKT
jgi:hypothetical protein